jgi:proline iminopeptidase
MSRFRVGDPSTTAVLDASVVEDRVLVNGVELFTRRVGAGPTTVVLHGGPGAHHDYLLPQYDWLAHHRTLQYYDQRGGGRSPVPWNVSVDWQAHVDDLHALLGTWDLAQVTLLGFSWGGLLALLYATTFPAAVDRLALVCPAPTRATDRRRFEIAFEERSSRPAIVAAREALRASDLRATDPAEYRRRMFALSVAGYFHRPAVARDLTPFRVTERTLLTVWRSLGGYDLRESIVGLDVPALVIAGRHDPIPLDTVAATARQLRGRLVVFDESGHCPHVEEPERFIEVLDEWLPRV